MSHASLNYSLGHPNDEVPTPEEWFKNMEAKSHWKEKEIFKGKTIFFPCDDIRWSGFAKYFIPRFDELGIKKLIFRSYNPDGGGRVFIKTEETEEERESEGHGDFREEEAKRLRDEADIVVTNPPYSQKKRLLSVFKVKTIYNRIPYKYPKRQAIF